MDCKAVEATDGALVVDSLPFSQGGTEAEASALKSAGVFCLVGYLGAISAARIGYLLAAGVAFMPVTFGDIPRHYDGAHAAATCQALGLPAGVSVWLDCEGLAAWKTPDAELVDACNAWADAVRAAGYSPCLYVGVPEPLTSEELSGLRFDAFWHGQGRVVDHAGRPAAPDCGYVIHQAFPSCHVGGVWVDTDALGRDQLGRLPTWAVAA